MELGEDLRRRTAPPLCGMVRCGNGRCFYQLGWFAPHRTLHPYLSSYQQIYLATDLSSDNVETDLFRRIIPCRNIHYSITPCDNHPVH